MSKYFILFEIYFFEDCMFDFFSIFKSFLSSKALIASILIVIPALVLVYFFVPISVKKMNQSNFKPLTPEEERVIVHKGTEAPFSGKYDKFFEEGMYVCRRCSTPLYTSNNKFDSGCGWPSFDQEIPGAVKHVQDPDGMRMEIICNKCGAHLGHVFKGEKLTPKNVRHCVNSVSLMFLPKKKNDDEIIVFGGGCFWCIEAVFQMLKGISSVASGYAGGEKPNPTYKEVCSGATEHAEVVKVLFDSTIIKLDDLLAVFFAMHDPTTRNRQGNDVGTQYRSVIFYTTAEQKQIIESFIKKLESEKTFEAPIVTQVLPLPIFYPAEEYHQNYYRSNAQQGYCQVVISPKIAKLRQKYAHLLNPFLMAP